MNSCYKRFLLDDSCPSIVPAPLGLLTEYVRFLDPDQPASIQLSNKHSAKPRLSGRLDFPPSVVDLVLQQSPLQALIQPPSYQTRVPNSWRQVRASGPESQFNDKRGQIQALAAGPKSPSEPARDG